MNEPLLPTPRTPSPGLQRLCLVVRTMTALAALGLLVAVPWMWSSSERIEHWWMHSQQLRHHPVTVDTRALWSGALLSLLPLGVGLATLWQLWRLFGEYAAGRVFGRRAQRHLKRFAVGVLLLAALAPLMHTLLVLVLTLGNPPGQRLVSLGFSSDDYARLLLGAVLLAIARVMEQAVEVAEDHAGFV